MLDTRSKDKLEKYMVQRRRNVARLIYILHRFFNEWAEKKWEEDGWGEIRPEHLRLISIVGTDRVNNNELAKRARVSKQAMSKMVNDLERRGFIDVRPDQHDSRAKMISVSKEGVDFLGYLCSSAKQFEQILTSIMDRKKTEKLIDILSELTEGIIEKECRNSGKKPG